MISKFTATEGQTVFDLGINLYTDLDNVINLLQSSSIAGVNESDLNQKVLNYNTDLISDLILYKYVFSKRKRFNTGYKKNIPSDYITSQTWKDSNNNYWLVAVGFDNITTSIQVPPVSDYIDSQLWIDSLSQYWTVTIDLNGIFSVLNEGSGTPIVSELWDNGQNILIQTIDLNGNFQFN